LAAGAPAGRGGRLSEEISGSGGSGSVRGGSSVGGGSNVGSGGSARQPFELHARSAALVVDATAAGEAEEVAAARRVALVRVGLGEHGGGEAVVDAVRARLRSLDEVPVLNARTLFDELMRTCPSFYRHVVGPRCPAAVATAVATACRLGDPADAPPGSPRRGGGGGPEQPCCTAAAAVASTLDALEVVEAWPVVALVAPVGGDGGVFWPAGSAHHTPVVAAAVTAGNTVVRHGGAVASVERRAVACAGVPSRLGDGGGGSGSVTLPPLLAAVTLADVLTCPPAVDGVHRRLTFSAAPPAPCLALPPPTSPSACRWPPRRS